jgi:hypothetical protein
MNGWSIGLAMLFTLAQSAVGEVARIQIGEGEEGLVEMNLMPGVVRYEVREKFPLNADPNGHIPKTVSCEPLGIQIRGAGETKLN